MNNKFKKALLAICVVATLVAIASLGYLGINKRHEYKLSAHTQYYLNLMPHDLWGTPYYGVALAKARVESAEWTATQYNDPYQAIEYGFDKPGEYRWVNWVWETQDYKDIFEPIYGSGIWIRNWIDDTCWEQRVY